MWQEVATESDSVQITSPKQERCNARVVVDDGSGDGKQEHLGRHGDSERLREVFGMFHVANERRDEGVPVRDPCESATRISAPNKSE